MSYLHDFDTPFEMRREQRPAPGARTTAPRIKRRPEGWRPRGVMVEALPGESGDRLIRRFRTAVEKDGLLRDIRRKEHFVPASQARRSKRARAATRRRKARA